MFKGVHLLAWTTFELLDVISLGDLVIDFIIQIHVGNWFIFIDISCLGVGGEFSLGEKNPSRNVLDRHTRGHPLFGLLNPNFAKEPNCSRMFVRILEGINPVHSQHILASLGLDCWQLGEINVDLLGHWLLGLRSSRTHPLVPRGQFLVCHH